MRARAPATALEAHGIAGEVIVADNASEDGSAELAAAAGARVVHEPRRGYGSAYLAGFAAARGEYIVMADADLTYDFDEIPRFVERARRRRRARHGRPDGQHPAGRDAVAAPLRRQPGAHAASSTSSSAPASATPTAACARSAATSCRALDLRTTGMEFASEMVIRASKEKLDIREFPIEYHPRGGESKLSSFRDGWRHLRFLLVHSPTHLFILPGAVMALLGALIVARRCSRSIDVFGRQWDLHAMIAGALLMIVGTQVVALGLCAHAYGTYFMGEQRPVVRPHARALPARARAAARRRDHRSPASSSAA